MRTWLQRLLFLVRRGRVVRELDEELQFHLDMKGRALAEDGMPAAHTRDAARRTLGGSTLRVREQATDVWIWRPLDALLQDLRYAVRVLRRQPRFVAAALATLALGIGANSAVFSLVDAMLLKPLPFPAADRLVLITAHRPQAGMSQIPLSYLNFADVRARARTFASLGAWAVQTTAIDGRHGPEQVQYAMASTHLFQVLGVTPMLGRTFVASEERMGTPPVAILSHGLWQRAFNGDTAVVGSRVTVNGRPHEIVGVMPAGFRFATFPQETDVWVSIGSSPTRGLFFSRGQNTFGGIGRLRDGVTLAQAQAELESIAAALALEDPGVNRERRMRAVALADQASTHVRTALLVLTAAVGLVLLLACANVANLLLVRASSRAREMAVRTALGCSRARLASQLLVEHLVLALAAGAIGFGLALVARDVLAHLPYNTADLFTPYLVTSDEIALDRRVLLFTMTLSIATGLVFGLLPTLRRSTTTTRRSGGTSSLMQALAASGTRATDDRRTMRVRGALIVAEVALSAMLLTGMALMLESFLRVRQVDPGLDPRQVVAIDLRLPSPKYPRPHQIQAFYTQALERLRGLSGVASAATVEFLPFSGVTSSTSYFIDGRPMQPEGQRPHVHYRAVSEGYFETMAIRVVRGRTFAASDAAEAPRVAVINEAMARQAFPGENPIGKRLTLDFEAMRYYPDRPPDVDVASGLREVVGVVADIHHGGLAADVMPEMFMPAAQRAVPAMTIVLRTGGSASGAAAATPDAAAIVSAARAIVRSIDPAQPVGAIVRLEDLVTTSIARPRFNAMLLSTFGLLALVLAAVGVYGVMSYAVALRTRDVGIHVALGAAPRDIWRMVIGQALKLTTIGTIVGLIGAIATSRVLSTLLFDVDARNPTTFVLVAIVLGVTSALAAYLPARRALRIDPVAALRAD